MRSAQERRRAMGGAALAGAATFSSVLGTIYGADYGIQRYFPSRKKRRREARKERRVKAKKEEQNIDEHLAPSQSLRKMPGKRKSYGKRNRYRKKRRRGGKRKSYGRRPSRGAVRARLQDLLAPPQTLKIASSQLIESPGATNRCIVTMGHCLNGTYGYASIKAATGDAGQFVNSDSLSSQAYVVFANQLHRFSNNTDFPVYIQAWEMVCRYDWRDSDYDATVTQYRAPSSIIQMLYQSKISETSDAVDLFTSFNNADSTNNRHYPFVTMRSHMSPLSRSFNELFKIRRKYKSRLIKPGDTTRYKMTEKKRRKLISHIHMQPSGNHNSHVFAGRTKFLMFKVYGGTAGTKEAEGATENDEKVASAGFELQHEIFDTYTIKSIEPDISQRDVIDNRPAIGITDATMIVDEDYAVDIIED